MTVKFVSLLIAFFLSLPSAQAVAGGKPLRVLTSFLPIYLFTEECRWIGSRGLGRHDAARFAGMPA